jgi:hypothetical protein
VELLAVLVGQHGLYLGQRTAGTGTQGAVGMFGHPAGTQHQRFQLLFTEHQRWQHEAGAQHIPDTRLTLDMGTLRLQGRHIPVEGAQTNAKLAGQLCAGDGVTVAAQQLEQGQQAFGTGHGVTPRDLWLACHSGVSGYSGRHQILLPRKERRHSLGEMAKQARK